MFSSKSHKILFSVVQTSKSALIPKTEAKENVLRSDGDIKAHQKSWSKK